MRHCQLYMSKPRKILGSPMSDESRQGPSGELAPYAASSMASRGRLHDEEPDRSRTPFQRDRDRIIHATAFRRLTYKTQVFLYHEGDHYRTRLTHSLEVAQIARSMARTLRLDEDLAEAIALAHDLGHTPFGHAGEDALDRVMAAYGGFDHNAQSLRLVTRLERKYADFDGLNLTWETLEGLVKHNGPLTAPDGIPIGAFKKKGIPEAIRNYTDAHDLALDAYPSLEAQVAALADDIAYNNHDIDDGFRAEFYQLSELADVRLAGTVIAEVQSRYPGLEETRLIYEVNRRLITKMIEDAVGETRRRLDRFGPASADQIRAAAEPVASFSGAMNRELGELRTFLHSRVYGHARVKRVMAGAQQIVSDLFERYLNEPAALPPKWLSASPPDDRQGRARNVSDFIAGMTDRYAIGEHGRLFDRTPELR